MLEPRYLIPVFAETDLEAATDADLAALADALDRIRRGIAGDARYVGTSATMDAADAAAFRTLVAIRQQGLRRRDETQTQRSERRRREAATFARRSHDAAFGRAIDFMERHDPDAAAAYVADITDGVR